MPDYTFVCMWPPVLSSEDKKESAGAPLHMYVESVALSRVLVLGSVNPLKPKGTHDVESSLSSFLTGLLRNIMTA